MRLCYWQKYHRPKQLFCGYKPSFGDLKIAVFFFESRLIQGPLPKANDAKVYTTLREMLVDPLQECAALRGYDKFTDLPGNRLMHVYSL